MRISVTGPQGSGKTTQAKLLADFLGIPLISVGEILREKAKHGNQFSKKIKESLDRGEMVDDEIVHRMVKEKLSDNQMDFVMDGYPRSLDQLNLLNPQFDMVFYLEIADSEVVGRLLKRGRADDTPVLIKERLSIYHQLTEPLLARYKEHGILHIINGSRLVLEVQNDIRKKVNEF